MWTRKRNEALSYLEARLTRTAHLYTTHDANPGVIEISRKSKSKKVSISAGQSIADAIAQHGRMLIVDDLAEVLAMSPKTIYAKVKSGTIPASLIGGAIRFDPHLIAEWLRQKAA